MEFSRQEYWSGLPFPPPGGLPNSGIEPRSPALQAEWYINIKGDQNFLHHCLTILTEVQTAVSPAEGLDGFKLKF